LSQWLEVYFLCADVVKCRCFDDETGILLQEMASQSGEVPESETRINTFVHGILRLRDATKQALSYM